MERRASLVIVARGNGKVLGISRGENLLDWGLPGGRADATDEGPAHTAARELREESGVLATRLSLVDCRVVGRYFVTTFFAEEVDDWPQVLRSEPFEGHVAFVSPKKLVAPTCRYREHTGLVLRKAGIL